LLLWATRGVGVPPLVTTGPATAGPGVAGAIGQPGTSAVFGNERMLDGLRAGLRVGAGGWFDDGHAVGADVRFYTLGNQSDNFAGVANGSNVVNVPQFTAGGVQFPIYVGFPGLTTGTVSATAQTRFLGGDANLLHELTRAGGVGVSVFAGYRYLHLGDRLGVSFDAVPTAAGAALLGAQARLMGEDDVRTRNDFHGGQVGLMIGGDVGRFAVGFRTSLAMGTTVSDLDASRTRSVGVAPAAAGLAALLGSAANIPVFPVVQTGGRISDDYFAVVPEVGLKLGYRVTDHVVVSGGYNFLYWSKVRRAQDQFDLSPAITGATTSFWAHGLSLGLDVRY
jgi:hypothetical protein